MPGDVESLIDTSASPAVRGVLHHPARPSTDGLVLTHGAGGNRDMPLLVALAEHLANAGVTVLRCDLPFRQRATGPPRGSGAEDRDGLRHAVEVLRHTGLQRVYLGGQSYGGRQASMLVAEEPAVADGLLLLSYPLHAPGRPDQLRSRHLPGIRVPSLFVSGSKDPFGTPKEIQAAIKLIPATTSFLLIEGGGHDLGYGRRVSKAMHDVPERAARRFLEFFAITD